MGFVLRSSSGGGSSYPGATCDDVLVAARLRGTQNDLSPSNGDNLSYLNASTWELQADSALDVTGIGGGFSGRRIVLVNADVATITLVADSVLSQAANRFNFTLALTTGATATIQWSRTLGKWLLVAASAAITIPGGSTVNGDLTVEGNLFVNGIPRNVWLGDLNIQSAAPQVLFTELGAAVDNRWWDFVATGEQFLGRVINDANNVVASWIQVDRTGTTVDAVRGLGTQWQFPDGTALLPGCAFGLEPSLGMYRSAAGTLSFGSDGTQCAFLFANAANAGRLSVANAANSTDIAFSVTSPGVAQRFQVLSNGTVILGNVIRSQGYTVATLPAGNTGDRAHVTDAAAPVFGNAVVGGGAVIIPVFKNATQWIVG